MLNPFGESERVSALRNNGKPRVVVAGPSSDVTIPGVITTEVVGAISAYADVIRVAVNLGKHHDAGLDRAQSLSSSRPTSHTGGREIFTPSFNWQRRPQFNEFFDRDITLAVALAWPGINCSWIGDFVRAAKVVGTRTVVLVVSHSTSRQGASLLTHEVLDADLVIVGDVMDANLLGASLGRKHPVIEIHRSLSLTGREVDSESKTISTFLPKDDERSLQSVLAAFDATPQDWVKDYDMRVIMRYSGRVVPELVGSSFHSNHIQLIGDDFSSIDLRRVASDSSAVSVANPELDSRVLSTAMDEGVATVVLSGDGESEVGIGYVGGLIADVRRPTSVYVAHNHAIRLSQLKFPSPEAWFELAIRLGSMWSDEPGGLVQVSTS